MTTKQYLGQIDRLDKIIKNKLTEIYQLKTMACNIVVSNESERVQTSGNQERMASTVAKIVDREREIDELTDLLIDKKELIISQIEGIEDNNQYQILFSYFVKGSGFTDISKELCYTRMHVSRLFDDALAEFEKKYGYLYLNE